MPMDSRFIEKKKLTENSLGKSNEMPRGRRNFMEAQVAPVATSMAKIQRKAEDDGSIQGMLQIEVPYDDLSKHEVVYVFVLDKSGSMAGQPWRLVQEAVRKIELVRSGINQKLIKVKYIIYNNNAVETSAKEVLETSAGEGTDFLKAFRKVRECLTACHLAPGAKAVIVFLTDGEHTAGSIEPGLEDMKTFFSEHLKNVNSVVHTVGFSTDHCQALLEKIRVLGKEEGFYRFANNSSYGNIKEKLAELFEFSAASVDVTCDYGTGPVATKAHLGRGTARLELWTDTLPTVVNVRVADSEWSLPVKEVEADWLFILKKIERQLDNVDFSHLGDLQEQLTAISPFALPKEVRQEALEIRAAVQSQLDVLHSARADHSRAGAAAMNADLRFAATFSKARRQRAMDIRIAKNAATMELMHRKLESLQVEDGAFAHVDSNVFSCDISHITAQEAVMDGDVLGLGVALFPRGEHLIDAPTCIQVASFSATIISKETFEQAIRFNVPLKGAQRVHGGFSGSAETPNGAQPCSALTGRAREPINAWLPLYVCDAHFRFVETLLQPILGYFFTLDPLGYKDNQQLALLTMLGYMHEHFNAPLGSPNAELKGKQELGRQLLILQDYTKLCSRLLPSIERLLGHNILEEFLTSSAGRSKGAVQVLHTVVGWAAAGEDKSAIQRLRQPLLEEAVHRYLADKKAGMSHVAIWETIRLLLYGEGSKKKKNNRLGGRKNGVDFPGRRVKQVTENLFSSYAQFKVGLSKKKIDCPEFEPLPQREQDQVDRDDLMLDVESWDALQSASAERLMMDSSESLDYLRRAVDLPELTPGSILYKAILVNSLMGLDPSKRADCGELPLAADDPEAVLRAAHTEVIRQEAMLDANQERARSARHVASLIAYSGSMWAFCGRLMAKCESRGGDVWDNLVDILKHPPRLPLPHHHQKVQVIILGRFIRENAEGPEAAVLAGGYAWRLTRHERDDFRAAIGAGAMSAIELLLAGRVDRWIYRGWPGDIPNRHGYCNSHPSDWALGFC